MGFDPAAMDAARKSMQRATDAMTMSDNVKTMAIAIQDTVDDAVLAIANLQNSLSELNTKVTNNALMDANLNAKISLLESKIASIILSVSASIGTIQSTATSQNARVSSLENAVIVLQNSMSIALGKNITIRGGFSTLPIIATTGGTATITWPTPFVDANYEVAAIPSTALVGRISTAVAPVKTPIDVTFTITSGVVIAAGAGLSAIGVRYG